MPTRIVRIAILHNNIKFILEKFIKWTEKN